MPHKIHFHRKTIPPGARILSVRVRVPQILFATEQGVLDDLTITETQLVYVELCEAEWQTAQTGQAAVDALGQALGDEIATVLGGYVKGWRA